MLHRESSLYAHRNTMSEAHMAVAARSSVRSGDSNMVGRSGRRATVPGEGCRWEERHSQGCATMGASTEGVGPYISSNTAHD